MISLITRLVVIKQIDGPMIQVLKDIAKQEA